MLVSEVITEVAKQIGADHEDADTREKLLLAMRSSLRKFPLYCRTRAIVDTAHAQLNIEDNYINPLPADFFEERAVYYFENNRKRFIDVDEQRFLREMNTEDVGTPTICRVLGETLEFNCKTDRPLVIYIEYYKEIDNIVETDSWGFDSNMLEVAKEGCKYYYLSDYAEDQAKGKEKLALFNDGLERIEERHMIKMVGGHVEGNGE